MVMFNFIGSMNSMLEIGSHNRKTLLTIHETDFLSSVPNLTKGEQSSTQCKVIRE